MLLLAPKYMLKKIASNTISQIISKAGTAIISIFLISLLTNYLSVEMYGLYSKVYNYIGIFVFLADLWLYAITITEITNNKENTQKIVGNVLTLRLILWIAILFLALFFALFLPWYNSTLALLSIAIASVFTILQLINSSILALMQAHMKIEFSAFSLISAKLINLWLISLVAYVFYPKTLIEHTDYFTPFLYIMSVWVVSVFINTLLNYFYARKKIIHFGFAFDFDYIKHIFKTALPYGLALFLSVFYFKMDVMLISVLEGPEKWDVSTALYAVPMKIVEVIMVIWGFYMTSLLPSLTNLFKNNDTKWLQKITTLSFKILFAFASMVVSLWILFRAYMIQIIANSDYLSTIHNYNSSDAFLIVFFVLLFYFLSLVFIYFLVASKNQSKLLKINIIVTVCNFVGNMILIPKYSFVGAGIVTLLSQILLFVLWYFQTKKLLDIQIPIAFMLKNIMFWIIVYLLWFFVLAKYSVWVYFDFFVYGGALFLLYLLYFYFEFQKERRD